MDLFGAATMGVDPQTGSYLTREQRVAMFRASRGMGGGSRRAGGPARPGVSPQSSIVAVKNNGAIIEKLQNSYQETASTISEQVVQNKKNIQALFSDVIEARKRKIASDKKEVELLRRNRAERLRNIREGLLDGLSTAAAGVAQVGGKAIDKAMKPVKNFFDKLRTAFGLLLGAWAIDNLPEIFGALKRFTENLPTLEEFVKNDLTRIRGVWSLLDDKLKSLKTLVVKIGRTALKFGKDIVDDGLRIGKKVFGKIATFLDDILQRGLRVLSGFLGRAVDGISSALGNSSRPSRAGGSVTRATQCTGRNAAGANRMMARVRTPSLPGSASGGGNSLGKLFSKFTDFGRNALDKTRESLSRATGSIGSKLKEFAGSKPRSLSDRVGWLQRALEPLSQKFPQLAGGIAKAAKNIRPLLRAIPLLGFGIDLALNKAIEGQDWTQAIIRSLGSSIVGGVSAAVGAKVGGGAGAIVGTAVFPGIGTLIGGGIGAALGAIIAGIGGGYLGDQAGAKIFEMGGGEITDPAERKGGSVIKAINSALDMTGSDVLNASTAPAAENSEGLRRPDFTASGSTPSGMDLSKAYGSNTTFIDIPGTVQDIRQPEQAQQEERAPGEAVTLPSYPTQDSDMNGYRLFASDMYQLVIPNK